MFNKKFFVLLVSICICSLIILGFAYKNQNNDKIVKDYKGYYDKVQEALYNFESTLTIDVDSYDEKIYNLDVVKKVLEDNPELAGSCTQYKLRVNKSVFYSKLTFSFTYYESKEELERREKAVQNKIKEIISKVIKENMKDYEKEAAFHDYIINHTKYDNRYFSGNMPKESYTAYGVLINGVGVCQGYAQAMDRLLKGCGIESKMVIGEANDGKGWIGHAWNIVKLGGKYYHLDLTWDDPVSEDGSNQIRYSYFNITDEQIEKNHKWNMANYPKCNSTEYSFKNLNLVEKDSKGNIIIVTKNYEELYIAVKKELSRGSETASFKILDFDNNQRSIENSIMRAYEALSKGGQFTYSYYKDDIMNSGYITINFK